MLLGSHLRAGGSSDLDRAISAHIPLLQFSLIGSALLNRWNPIVGSLLCSQQNQTPVQANLSNFSTE
jgi:hypothetical protein